MKKRMIVLMCIITSLSCLTAGPVRAENAVIPEEVGELRFFEEYRLEPGSEEWYRFTAPSPECYLTEQGLKRIGDYLYGLPVNTHGLYSADGTYLGVIGYSDDPELGGWNEFEPGETYYLKVKSHDDPLFFTFAPVLPEKDRSRSQPDAEKTAVLTLEKVERFIPGEMNSVWDVYTVIERFEIASEGEACATDFFILPCDVYFDNETLILDSGDAVYSHVSRSEAESFEEAACYCALPSGGMRIPAGSRAVCADHYSYVRSAGKAIRLYEAWLPAGKRLIYDGGLFRTASASDLFNDVPDGKRYSDSVLFCVEKGYMSGMTGGAFSPSGKLTRAQTVQIMARLAGADLEAYRGIYPFSDVKKGAWYAKAVAWANAEGLADGVGNGLFAPSEPVTRQELAVFMKALADRLSLGEVEPADISGYSDASSVARWAKKAMAWAVGAGLISGTSDDTLSPGDNATRAQISVFVRTFDRKLLSPSAPSFENGSYFLEGGTCGYGEYQEMIDMTGKEEPNVLYIGFASSDPGAGYPGAVIEFSWRGCTTECLTLDDLTNGAAAEKIARADIIWVGGGDSRLLISRLRESGAELLLRRAAMNGTVMAGSSAGAICFGRYGASGTGPERYMILSPVGCVDLVVCPHGFEAERVECMKEFLRAHPGQVGVAVDGAALQIHDGMFRVYSEEFHASCAVRYVYENGAMREEDVNSLEWRPLSELYG